MSNFDEKIELLKILSDLHEQNFHCAAEIGETLKSVRKDLGLEDTNKFKVGSDNVGRPIYEHVKNISEISTKYLHEELVKREGVTEHIVSPYGSVDLSIDNSTQGYNTEIQGAAKILVNKD